MEFLFCLIVIAVLIWASNAIHSLEERVKRLEHGERIAPAPIARPETGSLPDHYPAPEPADTWEEEPVWREEAAPEPVAEKPAPVYAPPAASTPTLSLEQIISTRLGVWVGALAIMLGAVFLIKYSIDEGWLQPAVRVVLTGLLGLFLIGGGEYVRDKKQSPNAFRIAQGLSGAGFAALYGSVFAATSLYHLLPVMIGFIGLATVTAAAIVAALRFGMPIAYLGMFGGFITPLLVRSDTPEALPLFGYLFALSAMGMVVARRKSWWGLAWMASLGSLLWTFTWLVTGGPGMGGVMVFFGIPMVILTALLTEKMPDHAPTIGEDFMHSSFWINALTIGVFTLFLFLVPRAIFDVYMWGMAFALSLAVIVLTQLRPFAFRNTLLPMAVAMQLLVLRMAEPAETLLLLTGFTAMFGAAGYLGLAATATRRISAWLISCTLFASYVVASFKLRGLLSWASLPAHDDMMWGMGALALSAILIAIAIREDRRIDDPDDRQHVLAALSVGATSFISLSIMQVFPSEVWSTALALQAFATLWLYGKTRVSSLPPLAILLVFAVLFGNIFRIGTDAFRLAFFETLSVIPPVTLLTKFAVPGMVLLAAARLVDLKTDRLSPRVFIYAGSLLVLLALAHGMALLPPDMVPDLTNNMFVTSLLLAAGAFGARRMADDLLRPVMLGLLALGIWRLIGFHVLFANPLFTGDYVGSWPLLNAGSIGYLLPIIPLHIAAQRLDVYARHNLPLKGFFTFLLLFGSGLVVRQIFQGGNIGLAHTETGMAEQLSYSALGLAASLGLLTLAMRLKDMAWRWLSLVVTIVTVGKVFLIDAASLTGLLRVLAFIGLGLSLFALSAFYSRYIFRKDGP